MNFGVPIEAGRVCSGASPANVIASDHVTGCGETSVHVPAAGLPRNASGPPAVPSGPTSVTEVLGGFTCSVMAAMVRGSSIVIVDVPLWNHVTSPRGDK